MWGVLAIALKVSLNDLPSASIVWVRFFFAFLFMAVFHVIRRPHAFVIFRKPPNKLVIASLCLLVNYFGFMKGVEYTTTSSAQVFIQLGPVMFAMAGIFIFKEKINWKHITGFLILLGGLSLFYHDHLTAITNQRQYSLGIAWLVIASASWACYAILQKELAQNSSINQLNLFIYGFCALIIAPFTSFEGFLHLSFSSWLLMIFLGINTLVAYGAIALAFRHLEANKVSVIITMNPIITFLLLYIFTTMQVSWLKPEHLSVTCIVGAIIALMGASFVIIFTRKK
jgi:drug/metabolite transporter (DMT)-like permease